jgi:hypothetical protein
MTTNPRQIGATLRRTKSRLLLSGGALGAVMVLLLSAGTAAACCPPPSPTFTDLATIPLLDAIAANSTDIYIQGVANCSQIYQVNLWDSVTPYATVPIGNATCDEGALSLVPTYNTTCQNSSWSQWQSSVAAPGQGNWGGGGGGGGGGCSPCDQKTTVTWTLYDIVAGDLFEITNGGSTVTLLYHFPVSKRASENLGLTYDTLGEFDHDLIVTSSSKGDVWTFNTTTLSATLIATLSTYIGGPSIAPVGFGSYGGEVLIAEKKLGHVIALNVSGSWTDVTNWTNANAVTTIPSGGWGCGGCSFGWQHFVVFLANYSSGALEAFPASDFSHLQGDGLIAGGLNAGVASFTSAGASQLFLGNTERLSYITSIDCAQSGSGHHRGW